MVEHRRDLAVALANHRFRVQANRGRLSICKGEGEGEGLIEASTAHQREPLTSVLSPFQEERRNKTACDSIIDKRYRRLTSKMFFGFANRASL